MKQYEITKKEATDVLTYILEKLGNGSSLYDILYGHPYMYDILEWILREAEIRMKEK